MKTFHNILKQLRLEKNLSQRQLADTLDIGRSRLSNYEQGSRNPDYQTLRLIAEFFDVDTDYLLGYSQIKNKSSSISSADNNGLIRIILYDYLSCGSGIFVDDAIIDYITLPESMLPPNKEYFAQYASGNSMINENINDGDLLVFEKTNTIKNGEIGCFCIDANMATCKIYRYDQKTGIVMLLPANNNYDPIMITVENQSFKTIGKLILKISKTRY
jgi:repressor LexA